MVRQAWKLGLALAAVLSAAPAWAGSLAWTCPECGEAFQFAPTDSGYRYQFANDHLAMHRAAGATLGGNDPGMEAASQGAQLLLDTARAFHAARAERARQMAEEQERLHEEMERRRLEEERQREEQHQRLLERIRPPPGFQKRSLVKPPGAGVEVPGGSELLQRLKRAAALSRQAEGLSGEDAAYVAAEAFRAARGEPVKVDVGDVEGIPVDASDAGVFRVLQSEVTRAREQYTRLANALAVTEERREVVWEARKRAEEQVRQAEASPAPKEDKAAAARKLLEEMKAMDAKAQQDLDRARQEVTKAGAEMEKKAGTERDFVTGLGKRKETP